jgi:hypothetical protein
LLGRLAQQLCARTLAQRFLVQQLPHFMQGNAVDGGQGHHLRHACRRL